MDSIPLILYVVRPLIRVFPSLARRFVVFFCCFGRLGTIARALRSRSFGGRLQPKVLFVLQSTVLLVPVRTSTPIFCSRCRRRNHHAHNTHRSKTTLRAFNLTKNSTQKQVRRTLSRTPTNDTCLISNKLTPSSGSLPPLEPRKDTRSVASERDRDRHEKQQQEGCA